METTVPALPRPALLQVRPAPQPHAWGSRGIQPLSCPLCLPFSLLPSGTRKMDKSGGGGVLLLHPRQFQNRPSESTCPACCGWGAAGHRGARQGHCLEDKTESQVGHCQHTGGRVGKQKGEPLSTCPTPAWCLRNASWRSLEPLHEVWGLGASVWVPHLQETGCESEVTCHERSVPCGVACRLRGGVGCHIPWTL